MSTKKDLKYYLEHTDEMPTDPAEIERLTNEHMDVASDLASENLTIERYVTAADEKQEEKKEEAPPAKDEVKTDEVKVETPKPDAKPDGILAKDGKHVIPYSQLEQARARATSAEELTQQLNARIQELEAGKEKPKADPTLLSEDELSALEADSPTLAKVLRSQQEQMKALEAKLTQVATDNTRRASDEATEVKSEIQEAIDATPALAEWQAAKDQTMWIRASSVDKMLRSLPEYNKVSFKDRFDKVVELTKAAVQADEPPVKDEPKPLTEVEIRAAAAAKLKAASAKATPKTLSDIPGGAPPAQDERERVEQMSVAELGNKFMNMTSEQREAYLSQL